MKVGIVGSGRMGSSLGKLWAQAGHQVMFSDILGVEAMKQLAASTGKNASAGTPAEAAQFADVVVMAIPWHAVDETIASCGNLAGKTVLEIVNPLTPDLKQLLIGFETSAAEEIARRMPRANVVCAFNTVPNVLLDPAKREFEGVLPSVFYCGDHEESKTQIAELVRDAGFDAQDSGPLATARQLEAAGCLLINIISAQKAVPEMSFRLLKR